MPERDGKDQGEDSPKQACSGWFARYSLLATSGPNLYPPGVWFADAIFFSRVTFVSFLFLKKNLKAFRPSGHPPVRGENVKTFRWDHRLQIQNFFMVIKRVLRS